MKISQALERVFDGVVGAPTIIKTKKQTMKELFPILNQFNLDFQPMPFFNMSSTFLTSKLVDEVADLDIVEKIYVDWPVKIPEIPVGFTFSNFVQMRGTLGLGLLKSMMGNRTETRAEWVPTTESRRYLEVDNARRDGITGRGVNVAVVDSDASARAANHRQFIGKSVQRYQVRKMFQTDTNGHGSHVATTIAGSYFEAMPNIFVEGVAPESNMIFVKCLLTPMGAGSTSDCIKAMNIAIEKGAQIINLSLGSESVNIEDDPFVQAINDLPPEIIVVAASGNEGVNRVGSPAVANNSLAIGALNARDNFKAEFSNTGPELDFVMPGVNIFSGIARETLLDVVGQGPEAYSSLSGTSMATPHMTGMVALTMDMFKRKGYRPTVETFRQIGRMYGEPKSETRGYGPLTYNMIKRYYDEHLT